MHRINRNIIVIWKSKDLDILCIIYLMYIRQGLHVLILYLKSVLSASKPLKITVKNFPSDKKYTFVCKWNNPTISPNEKKRNPITQNSLSSTSMHI